MFLGSFLLPEIKKKKKMKWNAQLTDPTWVGSSGPSTGKTAFYLFFSP